MPIKSSGQLSFTEIVAEFADTAPHSMSEFYSGGGIVGTNNLNIPSSGPISFSNFYEASSLVEPGNNWTSNNFYSTLQSLFSGTWLANNRYNRQFFNTNNGTMFISMTHMTPGTNNEFVSELVKSTDFGQTWSAIPNFSNFLLSTWPIATFDDADVNAFAFQPSLNLVLGVPSHIGEGPQPPFFLIRSDDPTGETWTNNNTAATNLATALRDNWPTGVLLNATWITETNSGFVAAGQTVEEFAISTDGVTWTRIVPNLSVPSQVNRYRIIALRNVVGVIICDYEDDQSLNTYKGRLISFDDGQTWTNYNDAIPFGKIIYTGTGFIGIRDRSGRGSFNLKQSYYYSSDLVNWTERSGQFDSNSIISDIAFNGLKTIIVTQELSAPYKSRLYVSSDGLNWTEKTSFYAANPGGLNPNVYAIRPFEIFVHTESYGLISSS
jgi:hypothetical protein